MGAGLDYGFRAIIAPSYADIFLQQLLQERHAAASSCPKRQVNTLLERAKTPGYRITVDLETQTVSDDQGFSAHFDVDPFRRHLLLNGLDDIGLTLQHEADITAYEAKRPAWKRGTAAAA